MGKSDIKKLLAFDNKFYLMVFNFLKYAYFIK